MKMVKEVNGRLVSVDVTGYREATADDIARLNAQKARSQAANEIAQLKRRLQETDYMAIKFAEGQMTATEYEPMKAQRAAWRARINELENV